jgi:hypothetical protein
MSLFPQLDRSSLTDRLIPLPQTMSAGDLLYFADAPSPFFEETGMYMVSISGITERSIFVKKYSGKTLFGSAFQRAREVPLEHITYIRESFPFAPDGRVFSIYLKKA